VNEVKKFHDEVVPVDGMWIDMNEPSNSGCGTYRTASKDANDLSCPISGNDSYWDNPPYATHKSGNVR